MTTPVARAACAAALACLLCACGGGGGDSSTSAASVSGSSGATGLLPAAPVPGAVLYPQASVLRPLQAGSRWVYRSIDYTTGSASETVIRQSAGTGGAIVETDSSSPDAPAELKLNASTGAVEFSTALSLGDGITPIRLSGAEFRSPVRAGEQIAILDQRGLDAGADFDGDRRNDSFDIAAWRVVVGNEAVSLPNLATPLAALRVDSFASVRLVPSSGAAAIVNTARVSTWYAPGIGVVRQTVPASAASRALDSDQVLLGYDGLTQGYGYLIGETARLADTGDVSALFLAAKVPDGVVAFDGQHMLLLDRNGGLRSSHTFAPGGVLPLAAALLQTNAGLRHVTGSFPDYAIYAIADDGSWSGAPPTSVSLGGGRGEQFSVDVDAHIAGAPGAERFWVAWQRTYTPAPGATAVEIVLRAVSPSGALLSQEIRLPTNNSVDPSSLRLVARGSSAVVSWQEYDTGAGYVNRLAFISSDGTVSTDRAFAGQAGSNFARPPFNALTDGNRLWVTWSGRTAVSEAAVPHGLAIDDSGLPIGTGADASSLLAARIDNFDNDIATEGWPFRLTAVSGRWFASGSGYGRLYGDVDVSSRWLTFVEYDPGFGAPAGAVIERMKVRIPLDPLLPAASIVFDDRVLLLTTDGGRYRPTVIWRR